MGAVEDLEGLWVSPSPLTREVNTCSRNNQIRAVSIGWTRRFIYEESGMVMTRGENTIYVQIQGASLAWVSVPGLECGLCFLGMFRVSIKGPKSTPLSWLVYKDHLLWVRPRTTEGGTEITHWSLLKTQLIWYNSFFFSTSSRIWWVRNQFSHKELSEPALEALSQAQYE